MSEPDEPPSRRRIDPADLAELRASIETLRTHLQSRLLRGAPAPEAAADPDARAETSAGFAPAAALRRRLSDIDWMELFERTRRRFSVLGMEERSGEVDEFGLDLRTLDQARPVLDFLYDRWWRVSVHGAEHLPEKGPVLLVANCSGVLPYDGLMLSHAIERVHPARVRPRFLVADWLFTLPFVQPTLARLGAVRACPENAERLLAAGHWVIAFPEGQKGALKPFSERYRLQRFARGGFVSLAIRQRAPMVPVGIVGAEEIHPVLFRPTLARRLLGVTLPVTPTFPWLGPLGLVPLPSRWTIRFGEPLSLAEVPLERAEDPLFTNRTRERVRSAVQELLDEELRVGR
jgi:1-acyl-sn-glycerol-3-phosphate acyltransferase